MKFSSADLKAFEDNLKRPERILKQIGEMMRSRAEGAFNQQSRGTVKWRERSVPNIMGIISDLERGVNVRKRRFDSRPALMDTGNLLRSLGRGQPNIEMTKKYTVEVGTPVPYAGTLNQGGVSEKAVTGTVKKNLAKYLKRTKGRAKRTESESVRKSLNDRQKRLGWLFRVDRVRSNIPARPFIIITPLDLKDATKIVTREFTRRIS